MGGVSVIGRINSASAWFSGPYGPGPEGFEKDNAPYECADELRGKAEEAATYRAALEELRQMLAGIDGGRGRHRPHRPRIARAIA